MKVKVIFMLVLVYLSLPNVSAMKREMPYKESSLKKKIKALINGPEDSLMDALLKNDFTEYKRIIEDFNMDVNDRKLNLLKAAILAGNTKCADYLLNRGAAVDIKKDTARLSLQPQPLVFACGMGKLEIVKLLVERKANIRFMNDCALQIAALYNRLDIVEYLLSNGAYIDAISNTDNMNITNELNSILNSDKKYAKGTALFEAVNNNYLDLARLLLYCGASLTQVQSSTEITLLKTAISHGYKDMIDLLIQNGARLYTNGTGNIRDMANLIITQWPEDECIEFISRYKDRITFVRPADNLIARAIYYSKQKLALYLINQGFSVNNCLSLMQTKKIMPPDKFQMQDCSQLGNYEIQDFFEPELKKCELANITNITKSCTPLALALEQQDETIIQILINAGADLLALQSKSSPFNAMKDYTQLMIAIKAKNDHSLIKNLLAFNLDVNVKNSQGKTALMYALSFANDQIINLLLKAGAVMTEIDHKDRTAFYFLAKGNVLSFYNQIKESLELTEEDKQEALYIAIKKGSLAVANELIKDGVNVDLNYSKNGESYIDAAFNSNDDKIVEFVLSHIPKEQLCLLTSDSADNIYCKFSEKGQDNIKIYNVLLKYFPNISKQFVFKLVQNSKDKVFLYLYYKSYGDNDSRFKNWILTIWKLQNCGSDLFKTIIAPLILNIPMKFFVSELGNFVRSKNPSDLPEIQNLDHSILIWAAIYHKSEFLQHILNKSKLSIEFLNHRCSLGYTAFEYAMKIQNYKNASLIAKEAERYLNEKNFPKDLFDFGEYKGKNGLKNAIEQGSLELVNVYLSFGAKPTFELAQLARSKGYLKIMHRLLFLSLKEVTQNENIATLGILFNA